MNQFKAESPMVKTGMIDTMQSAGTNVTMETSYEDPTRMGTRRHPRHFGAKKSANPNMIVNAGSDSEQECSEFNTLMSGR